MDTFPPKLSDDYKELVGFLPLSIQGILLSKIISFINQAGGMGKTTLPANVGYHLGQLEKRVLLVDMDSQASLTRYCGLQPNDLESTIEDALLDEGNPFISEGWHGVDLIPANSNLISVYTHLPQMGKWHFRLKYTLSTLRQRYDYILIDCPPNLGPLSILSLIASTHLIIPVQTNSKGLEGAEDLRDTINDIRSRANRSLRVIGAVPTMFDSRNKHDREHLAEIRDEFGKLAVLTPIPKATDINNSWQARQPIAVFNRRHIIVHTLKEIANFLVRYE